MAITILCPTARMGYRVVKEKTRTWSAGMSSPINYRPMKQGEEDQVMDLVSRVFHAFVAPLFSDEGVKEFMTYADASALAERIKDEHLVMIAETGDDMIGIIEIRDPGHIALFFVAQAYQHQGIGRRLLKKAVAECAAREPNLTEITVNSSPNAVSSYQALGFRVRDEEKTINGIRFVQMSLKIS